MKSWPIITVIFLVLFNVSCRQEEYEFTGIPPERGISAGSEVASLLFRTSLKDGSTDNIIDGASCISIQLPFAVTIAGETYILNNLEEDLEAVTERLQEDDNDDLIPEIVFPITIISPDYKEIAIDNSEELKIYKDQCPEEDVEDADIECIDFVYPLELSIFDVEKEILDKKKIINDSELNSFIYALTEDERVTIVFPVQLVLTDDSQIVVEDVEALQAALDLYKDDCDEDDNNNFLEPDCEDCSSNEFDTVWATCTEWAAHKFKVDGDNIKDIYEDYSFNFLSDGTVVIKNGADISNGTWIGLGSGNDITLELNFPGLSDFNQVWNLKEFKDKDDDMIDVRLFNGDDELHIQSICDED